MNVFCQSSLTKWYENTDSHKCSAAGYGSVKMNSWAGKSRFFTKRVVQSLTAHTRLLKSIVVNTWQHTFPWSPFGQETLSGHPGRAAGLGRLSGQKSGLYWSHGQSSFWLQQSQDFSVTLSLHFLAFNITAYFLSNFRQTYFSLLTKIFMMNSNYSVVVVPWDLIVDQRASTAAACGCIIKRQVGSLFMYGALYLTLRHWHEGV